MNGTIVPIQSGPSAAKRSLNNANRPTSTNPLKRKAKPPSPSESSDSDSSSLETTDAGSEEGPDAKRARRSEPSSSDDSSTDGSSSSNPTSPSEADDSIAEDQRNGESHHGTDSQPTSDSATEDHEPTQDGAANASANSENAGPGVQLTASNIRFAKAIRTVIQRNITRRLILSLLKVPITSAQLCEPCASLQLTPELFLIQTPSRDRRAAQGSQLPQAREPSKFGIGSGYEGYEIGALRAIRIKSLVCPFCRLVMASLQEELRTGDKLRDASDARCFASWQLDGREYARSNMTANTTRPRTRRIRLHWSNGSFQDSYIVLVAQLGWGSSQLFLGRPVQPARISLTLVSDWLELCNSSHGSLCAIKRGEEFNQTISKVYFTVVDVQDMCLASLPADEDYIALSYTWGRGERYTTKLSNVRSLHDPDGVQAILHKLPRAIQDAINLVRTLGKRYLWVDSLCIIQDSRKSWLLNSRVMHLVYGNAYLTICAADGEDATAGLKALDPAERRFSQYIEDYSSDVQLMVSHLAETYIARSTWDNRAWTF